MAQASNSLPQYYGQQLSDGTIMESPGAPPHRGSSDSRQELLRLPAQPHPAHLDFHMESEIPNAPAPTQQQQQTSGLGLTPLRPRRPSQNVPYTPTHRPAYVEDYSDEEDYDPRPYYRRNNRRHHQRPPVSYNNYADPYSRYGPLPKQSDPNLHPAYTDTPGKPNYEMYYPYYEEVYARRPQVSNGGVRGPPPRGPKPESVMRLPWMIWMGSNAKNRKSSHPSSKRSSTFSNLFTQTLWPL